MKVIAFECISDCLGCNMGVEDIVNKLDGLNSVIELPSGDLANNRLFVMIRKLHLCYFPSLNPPLY